MLKLRTVGVIFALVGAMALAACGDDDNGSSDSGSSGGGDGGGSGSIALLLPESKTARYESQDRPNFEAKAKELCPDCKIIYPNADQDAAKQQQQAEAAITNGAKVLVLDPVDAASAGAIVQNAKSRQIPVISYDRLITDADIDYYISFDNEQAIASAIPAAIASGRLGSTRTAAPPATSGNEDRSEVTRRPQGHRLDHRQAVALVQRRVGEDRGICDDRRGGGIVEVAGHDDPVAHGASRDEPLEGAAPPPLVPDEDQPQAGILSGQHLEGRHETREVLAGLDGGQ